MKEIRQNAGVKYMVLRPQMNEKGAVSVGLVYLPGEGRSSVWLGLAENV